jgi:hypothetical protein
MRRGRKPNKEYAENRLAEIFLNNPIDERTFDVVNSRENPFVSVYHKNFDSPILKIHPLSEKYGLYIREDKRSEMSSGTFASNLDEFEDEFRRVRDNWI